MALRFRVGANTNWSDASTSWSLTTGGTGNQAVPTNADDVTFDANSTVNVTLDTVTAKVCKTLTLTNYTHTLTFNVTCTVSGSITLGASNTYAGSSALIINAVGTITTNAKTINIPFTFNVNGTVTLADAFAVSGLLTFAANGATTTLATSNITASGGVSCTAGSNPICTGQTITMTGGTWSAVAGAFIGSSVTFAGNVTISGTVGFRTGTLTYTSGTITTTGSTLNINTACTLNVASITWESITISANGTVTLSAGITMTGGTFTLGGAAANTTINGAFNVNIGGHLTLVASSNILGTATFIINGTGTWSDAGSSSGIANPLTINTAGTLTISGTVRYKTGNLTYTTGTLAGTSTPTLLLTGTTTIDFNAAVLPAILSCVTAAAILTLNSNIIISGTNGGVAFTGTQAQPTQIKSNTGGVLRKLTCQSGVTEDMVYCNPTDIDSRDGVPVYYAKGTLSNTFNWTNTNPGQAKQNQIIIAGTTFTSPGQGPQVFGS